MTLVTEAPNGSPSLNDSSAADFDFSALGEATEAEPESSDRTPDTKICPTCDKSIYRVPGSRGRMPRFHPECRPSAMGRLKDAVGGTTRRSPTADAKKGREADEVIAFVKPKFVQGATALMLFDHYDGFVMMTAIPGICDNLHGILVAHDGFRKQMLQAKGGGSILGLVVALAIPVAAICAHHGLIPSTRVAEIVRNLPIMLHKISLRMKQGEGAMNDMMDRVANQVVEEEEEKARDKQRDANQSAATPDPDAYLRTAA